MYAKPVVQNNQSNRSNKGDKIEVYINKFVIDNKLFVNICDKELYGKKLSTANGEIVVAEPFYGGDLVDVDTALKIASEAFSVNLLGERIVNEAIRKGLIHEKAVIKINNIPYAILISS